ncbi:unnamed protein product [Adineta ricciae]|uniref:Uncharacterized protein n=1 Tax=Adineta ricciae TaxID=249248 RepID=A0A815N6P8_ADIRI|nr:unnamed protein product [Adineta ricciae]CAF1434986.1 unnamed protein product [Adineta ricciae]
MILSQLCKKSELSYDEIEASNDHRSKKHKKADSFDDIESETIRKNKLGELHRKIEEMNALMRDDENADIGKITKVFKNLRKIISKYQETLKTKVREIEQRKKPSTTEYKTLIEKITQFLRHEYDDQSVERIDKLSADVELFKQQIVTLKTTKKFDYCIDELNELEAKINTVLDHSCVTEFKTAGTYGQLSCRGRACNVCSKCRDWYYIGDRRTWEWIVNENEWDEEDRQRWDDGEYTERFQERQGSTCTAHFGYYYDRQREYHGGHITSYMDCECGQGYDTCFIQHGRDGRGYRYRYITKNHPYCQCDENVKEKLFVR